MIEYALTKQPPSDRNPWGEIKFQTSSKEFYEFVAEYMDILTDAFKFRNRIEQIERPPVKLRG